MQKNLRGKFTVRNTRLSVIGLRSLLWLSLGLLLFAMPSSALAQSTQIPSATTAQGSQPAAPATDSPATQQPDQQSSATLSGTVVDQTGAAVAGAQVSLMREDQSPKQEVPSGDDGQFSFDNLAPGLFHLTSAAPGFATQTSSGVLQSGEARIVPPITLILAAATTQVRVGLTPTEIAEVQIQTEEAQRVLGFIPNFYVSYVPDAVPLSSKQKFQLAWRSMFDPVTFGVTAAVAGLEQQANVFSGYGHGPEGYAKRFGAAYADRATSTFIGSAVLPSLLKQDPRYFYKGTGSTRSRLLYAIKNSVICKGDNGRWQPNYSYILGDFTSSGLSNLYYPAQDRGVGLTFANAFIGIGATAAGNILQEFVIRKLTPHS
ncbi:MAG TPA: carboxypeptidase-like regulatory domain-containing protein [Candidatus Acidoferrales bacterium]|nr:carboxypeptidase-like regulatory domain-containing protein [Candidatus Acidoferrales bacterium]